LNDFSSPGTAPLSYLQSRKQSPRRQRILKKITKKKLTPEENKEQALYEIHRFYAR
jgi:hypothetical protein